jgi:HEXXH motif-containing protein
MAMPSLEPGAPPRDGVPPSAAREPGDSGGVDPVRLAAAMACPGMGTEEVALRLHRLYARAALRRFTRLPDGDALGAAWAQIATGNDSGALTWRPELGLALAHARQGRPAVAGVQLTLAAVGLGATGAWGLAAAELTEFMFAGHRFAVAGVTAIRAGDGEAVILAGHRPLLRFLAAPARATVGGHVIELLATAATTLEAATSAWESAAALLPVERLQAQTEAIAAGGAWLDETAPDYAAWAGRMTRCGLVLADVDAATGSDYLSSSHPAWPGLVTLGLRDGAGARRSWRLLAAETLVHEASHQYFHLLSGAFPVVNGRDQQLHYSALAKRSRPLDRVLLAYHAAGNMALAHAAAIEKRGASADGCASALTKAAEAARSLREPLERTDGLTEAGEALWRTLARALEARGLS